jgi:hypothetical protein
MLAPLLHWIGSRSGWLGVLMCTVVVPACKRPPAEPVALVDDAADLEAGASSEPVVELPPAPEVAASAAVAAPPPPAAEAGTCPVESDEAMGLVVSPLRAFVGSPVRALAATLADPEPLAMRIETIKGEAVDAEFTHRAGTPAMTSLCPRPSARRFFAPSSDATARRLPLANFSDLRRARAEEAATALTESIWLRGAPPLEPRRVKPYSALHSTDVPRAARRGARLCAPH